MDKKLNIRNKCALILDIQRMSTEDGPGIRSTVFFKGCTLSCLWCHNPESIYKDKEIQWIETKCIGCKTCINTCPNDALSMSDNGIIINRERCQRCLSCAKECPTLAMEVKGDYWEVEELVNEVIKDIVYFEKSNGGVTASGGEAMMYPDFVYDFFKSLKKLSIHTALDTCGMCSQEALEKVLRYTDLVLYDIKLFDSATHKRFTGQSNKIVLENLLFIADEIRQDKIPSKLWIRTPIIPDATASEENIKQIGEFIANNLNDVVSRWDLCAFNNLCKDKYKRLNIDWMFSFNDTKLLKKDEMNYYVSVAKKTGVNPEIVHWSGATQV